MGGSGSGCGVLPALLNLNTGTKQQQQFSWLLESPMIVSRSWPLTRISISCLRCQILINNYKLIPIQKKVSKHMHVYINKYLSVLHIYD